MNNNDEASKPVVLVTGGGRGIGRAVCRRFAADGAHVVAIARTDAELQRTADACRAGGGSCETLSLDLCDAGRIEQAVTRVAELHGRIDVLVNCAGTAALAGVGELSVEAFDDMLSVNVRAVFATCRAVWPTFVRQKGGVIVNISSMASKDPFPGLEAYGACKAWVNAWTVGLANQGRAHNVRAFSVAPGAVETKMLRDLFPDIPADQCLSPDDVAGLIHALCQPECQYASGQTVYVRR